MFMFRTMMPQYFPKLTALSWNFTEAGHGKGPMDGVGGTMKRRADQMVLHGKDVTSAQELNLALQDYKISLFLIPSGDIERSKSVVADLVMPPIIGITNIHQATWTPDKMHYRVLSCFKCPMDSNCKEFEYAVKATNKTMLKKSNKLSVDEVFTDSENENDTSVVTPPQAMTTNDIMKSTTTGPIQKNELVSGVHILVEYSVEDSKKQQNKQFIGICRSVLSETQFEVVFLKESPKDNTLFSVNEKDLDFVS